jgi:ribokinase
MRILNIGSLNIDHVYSIENFVRPGETISCKGMKDFNGGKGLNQSIALARAGAKAFHAGKVGRDGKALVEFLSENGVDTEYVLVSEHLPTGHAIIQVDAKGQNCIIIYAGANGDITKEDIDSILSNFEKGDFLLLQNEISNLEYAIEKAHSLGMQVALNPSPITKQLATSSALKYVDWFILNEIEGYEITGKEEGTDICNALKATYPNCKIVLTLGKKGCLYYDGKEYFSHGIYDVPVVDTTAAGDTFTGYFLACVSEGMSIDKALEIASKAASISVSRAGASPSIPNRKEVEASDMKQIVIE